MQARGNVVTVCNLFNNIFRYGVGIAEDDNLQNPLVCNYNQGLIVDVFPDPSGP